MAFGFPVKMYDVFLSYRWVDPDQKWVREQLAPALRKAGLSVLLDVDDFVPGRDLILEMARAGSESRCVLCVLSPDYFDGNRIVAFESLMARRLDPSGIETRLIPLMLRAADVPEWLRGLIPIDWTDEINHAREWRKLLEVLRAPHEGPPPGKTDSVDCKDEPENVVAPKYYVYVSQSKTDMLYAQYAATTIRRLDSIGKLNVILAALARIGRIGTVDEPNEYFAGTLQMRWGPCAFPHVPQLTPSPLVYFGGGTEKTVVGLGGSAKHVIGEVASAMHGFHSCLPGFIFQLQKELGEYLPFDFKENQDQSLVAVYMATTYGKGPSEELEFVAKRLSYGQLPEPWAQGRKSNVLVGTPLYVALGT